MQTLRWFALEVARAVRVVEARAEAEARVAVEVVKVEARVPEQVREFIFLPQVTILKEIFFLIICFSISNILFVPGGSKSGSGSSKGGSKSDSGKGKGSSKNKKPYYDDDYSHAK